MSQLPQKIQQTVEFLRERSVEAPKLGVILGTGLGALTKSIQGSRSIPYPEIPHFVRPTVEFHSGQLWHGRLSGQPAVVMQGRFHFYEGHSMEAITFPVRVMKALGVETLVVTNVAGAVNPNFSKGDIVVIRDHINLLGQNPLVGRNHDELGPRFPDLSEPYSREYIDRIQDIALKKGIRVEKGVYACMTGPSLETAAEYRMLRIIGADLIGMSTVPEVLVAVHAGLRVLAMSVVTDLCLPDHLEPIDIAEVVAVAGLAEPKLVDLILNFAAQLD